jgi:glycosyltransferase involved in cell wall biosynthesis
MADDSGHTAGDGLFRVFCFATQGSGGNEEARIVKLLSAFSLTIWPYDRTARVREVWRLLGALRRQRPDLVVMEGSGSPGGIAIMLARLLFGVPYLVSSGDAIAPFLTMHYPLLKPGFFLYEKLLCRLSSGFIGWTPYLVGRAITYGAPRGVTAAGFSHHPRRDDARAKMRAALNIPDDAIVFGLLGALVWTESRQYCYGLELVQALRTAHRDDVYVLIVGDGTGKRRLEQLAGDQLGERIVMPGRCSLDEVPAYLAAMDLGSLPQSVDPVGALRYTTKIAEYVSAGLPLITSQIPFAYDFDAEWILRLPGANPWNLEYVAALGRLMATIERPEIGRLRGLVPDSLPEFDADRQQARVTAFVADLLHARRAVKLEHAL